MENYRKIRSGGIRQRILSMLLITIILIIAVFSSVFLYQSNVMESLVDDVYEEQKQLYIDNGLEEQYGAFQSRTVNSSAT